MAELGKPSYVVLGMVRLGRRTGYEIKHFVDVSTRFFWAASYGQIYPELQRLERLGLLRGRRDDADGRRRKAYELTAAGERALEDWLTSDEPLHLELRHEGMLKLFFADAVGPEPRRELWRRTRQAHEAILEQLEVMRPRAAAAGARGGHEMPFQVLEFGIAYQRFLIDWCSRMEREPEALTPASGGAA